MKFDELIQPAPLVLDEVRMGKSDLNLFADSPEAEGIMAGFEAELCFRGLGDSEPDYDNPEEDMDSDTQADSIDEICEFFDDGDYNGRLTIRELRERMTEQYLEWRIERLDELWSDVEEETVKDYIEENSFDHDDAIREYLQDTLELSDEQVEAAIDAGYMLNYGVQQIAVLRRLG
jgi:hypothetical protein